METQNTQKLQNFSNKEFVLTEGEQQFIKKYLDHNDCGATTPGQLLEDNFSCHCIEDLRDIFGLTNNQIGGYLSSLQEKCVITLEERDGDICKSKNRIIQMNFEANLYWVNDSYLESLDENLSFS